MNESPVRVSFAMNDRYGTISGYVQAINFDDMGANAAEWESPYVERGTVCRYEPRAGHIRVSRRHFRVTNWSWYVGNVIWNEGTLSEADAIFLRDLLQSLRWTCTCHVVGGLFGPTADKVQS